MPGKILFHINVRCSSVHMPLSLRLSRWGKQDNHFSFNLHYDQQMHNYFTNYHNPTCFDTIMSSSGNL